MLQPDSPALSLSQFIPEKLLGAYGGGSSGCQDLTEGHTARADVEIPPMPEDMSARLSAIWADAYRAAVATVTPERDERDTATQQPQAMKKA